VSFEKLILEARLAQSTSEVRRLMAQNGFRVILPGGSIADAAIKSDPKEVCKLPSGTILMAGKRRFVRML
jgi:tyrosyl-tRNA synthetase